MKRIYQRPIAEITTVNLKNSVMEDVGVMNPSGRAGESLSNEVVFEDDEEGDFSSPNTSLWDN